MKQTLLILLFIWAQLSMAQVQLNCGTDDVYQQMTESDPAILQRQDAFNLQAKKQERVTVKKAGTVRIIPVVFHVIHRGGIENISDSQLLNGLDILNKTFRRLNANAADTRTIFQGIAADMEIEFRLARKDPKGNCTNGIVRLYDAESGNGSDSIKQKSIWPTDKYFNIWVVENITNPAAGGPICFSGYSQYPWVTNQNTDGIIIMHSAVGNIGTSNINNGTEIAHEAGHWLGCYHTFANGCIGGDLVDDTPPCADNRNSVLNCDFNLNTCSNDNPDLPDQLENYMDFTTSTCRNMFTIGQKARMDNTLAQWRSVIISAQNLIATGTDQLTTAANCSPIAGFVLLDNQRNPLLNACANGVAVNFTDDSYNYSGAINYQWIFEGGTPATSTQQNPSVQYQQAGKYDVTLIVSNAFGSDTLIKEDYMEVLPQTVSLKAPFEQDFETLTFPDTDWKVSSNTYTNFTITDVGPGSVIPNNSHTLFIENNSSNRGSVFDFTTPPVDISGMASPVLSFYYAFATRPQGTNNTTDALVVLYSTDCGQNWTQMWVKSGGALSTIGGSTDQPFVPADASKWKQVVIQMPLIPLVLKNNVRFKLQFASKGGNNFYLDGLNIGFPASVQDDFFNSAANFTVYPNPTAQNATIDINLPADSEIKITATDLLGRELTTLANGNFTNGTHSFNFTAADYTNAGGIYFIKLAVNGSVYCKKVVCTQ